MTTSLKHRLLRYLRYGLLIYLAIILLFTLFENSLVYFPTRYPNGDWNLPARVEDATFAAADGTKLHGWFVPAEHPQAVVLFMHGNGGCIIHRREILAACQELNVAALVFDYRGYGRSEGKPNEAGVLADARAARTWLAKKCGVSEQDVVLWGESLGGGVAVDLATDGARGLILENTFTSLPDAAAYHYPWLPVRRFMQHKLDSRSKIATYHGPLLQIHGDADTIVPYTLGKQLFDAANEPKQFVTIAGGDHNDGRTTQHFLAVQEFMKALPLLPK